MDIMTNSEKRTLKDKFMLRLPDGLRDRIKRSAAHYGRSMNEEIVKTLMETYPEPTDEFGKALMIMEMDITRYLQSPTQEHRKKYEDRIVDRAKEILREAEKKST